MRVRAGNKFIILCVAVLCGLLLVGCNDNGGEGKFAQAAVLPDESAAGIYFGTFTDSGGAHPVAYQAIGIISENYDAQFPIAFNSRLHYAGNVFVDGTDLSGTLTGYRGAWRRFSGIDGVDSADLVGSVEEANTISAEYTSQSGEGRVILDYNAIYERGSSLDLTSGIWSFGEAFLGGGAYAVTLEIDADGRLFGTDTDGCTFTGQLRIIDSAFNVYGTIVTIWDCGLFDGDYFGLAFLSDFGGGLMNVLTLSVSNDVFAFASAFEKN